MAVTAVVICSAQDADGIVRFHEFMLGVNLWLKEVEKGKKGKKGKKKKKKG